MNDTPLPQDPALPHLRLALDGPALAARFEAHTAPTGWHVATCAVDRVKYHPRRNLAVSYRLQLRDAGGATREQIVATRWCAGGASLARWHKAVAGIAPHPHGWPTVTHDAALDHVAHWWPHDARLAAARTLADTARLHARWLPEVVQALAGPGATLAGAHTEPVQVVPEHRITVRVQLQLTGGARHTVYAKADAEGRGARTQAAQAALWASPARLGGTLRLPRPLLWQPGSGLHWQSALAGQPLLDHAPQVGCADARAVGAMLSALHATPVPCEREETLPLLRQRLLEVIDTLALVDPGWTPMLRALALGLMARGGRWADAPMVTLHGDLHPRNVLRDADGTLGLIDLDSLRRGPALLDLGSWAADALYRALLAGKPATAAWPAVQAFADGYAQASGQALLPAELAHATAWQLLTQRAWRAAVNLKPGRYALIGPLLAHALQLLDDTTTRPAARDTRTPA